MFLKDDKIKCNRLTFVHLLLLLSSSILSHAQLERYRVYISVLQPYDYFAIGDVPFLVCSRV